MSWRPWSVARLMAVIATLAAGLATLQALRPHRDRTDPGPAALALVLSLALTAATDRVVFGRRHRAYWLGFAAAGWVCAALALTHLKETRSYILRYGPPIVRVREDSRRAVVGAMRSRVSPPPRPSESILFLSLTAELGLALAMGALAASAGGLFTASLGLFARQVSPSVRRLSLPGYAVHRSRANVPPGRTEP